jgi:hypothetical protein
MSVAEIARPTESAEMPEGLPANDQKERLLKELKFAVEAANDTQQNLTKAHAKHASRSKRVGMLLLDAKKLHPAVKDFEAFLKKVDGLAVSRAYDLMRLAGGRTTDEELRKETRDRVEKHRAKKRLSKAEPEPSVTSSPVTESAEADELPGPTEMESAEGRQIVVHPQPVQAQNAGYGWGPVGAVGDIVGGAGRVVQAVFNGAGYVVGGILGGVFGGATGLFNGSGLTYASGNGSSGAFATPFYVAGTVASAPFQWSAPLEVIHPVCWSEDHFLEMERWASPSCVRLMS